MAISRPALHRIQDLGAACEKVRQKEKLKNQVSCYYELRQLQNDAVEDGDTALASSIGRGMRELREDTEKEFGEKAWRVEAANHNRSPAGP